MNNRLAFSALGLFILLLIFNVVVLDIYVVFGGAVDSRSSAQATDTSDEAKNSGICQGCQELISREVSKVLAHQISPTHTPLDVLSKKNIAHVEEHIIPLGSGYTESNEWQELPGIEATIDTKKYPGIRTVTFETYLQIPTANGIVHAKLYNATDKHDVWFSEVSGEGNAVFRKTATVSLDSGEKIYRVMLKSTLHYRANLVNARLRIETN